MWAKCFPANQPQFPFIVANYYHTEQSLQAQLRVKLSYSLIPLFISGRTNSLVIVTAGRCRQEFTKGLAKTRVPFPASLFWLCSCLIYLWTLAVLPYSTGHNSSLPYQIYLVLLPTHLLQEISETVKTSHIHDPQKAISSHLEAPVCLKMLMALLGRAFRCSLRSYLASIHQSLIQRILATGKGSGESKKHQLHFLPREDMHWNWT